MFGSVLNSLNPLIKIVYPVAPFESLRIVSNVQNDLIPKRPNIVKIGLRKGVYIEMFRGKFENCFLFSEFVEIYKIDAKL